MDGVVEAGRKDLAEAAAYIVFAERRAFRLGKVAWERGEAIGRYTFKCDFANGAAFPLSEGRELSCVD
jgi:hypothetical protein